MKIVTIKEVSEFLNVKLSTVYQWAELGQIPCMKLNGCLRFDMEDIMNWIKTCKKEATSCYNPFTQARSPREGGRN